ncbi:hypothetical protein HAPAU_31720 [Halalkalicoccus paucihalophilus]|uniref:DUF8112 domain-containing protein n=1 Tax=Halalkalicoccus paucihalophilus TaxID=1008153 RepID=A0A151AAY6_9EURY|nr:hypothetical protein [Halalkalicoccus paucihalophilus]KYH24795.1 hypothetical protein HAPAU_31720 [Halalkalicoccus paucihalophilus]
MLTEISTNVTQLFAGARLSKTNPDCTACNRTLREGEQVTIYAAREEDVPSFAIERLHCRECTHEELTNPTRGLSEHLLRSRLSRTLDVRTQREFQTLGAIQTLDASAPSQGSTEAHSEEPPTALLRDTHIQNPASAVYHIDNGEGHPLCNCQTNAQYTPVPLAEAEASTARRCENCQIARQGEQATKPCPHCNAPVGMSAWPQHVRACTGDPTDAAEETDPDGDPAITNTDTQRATSPATRTGARTPLHQHQE